MSEQPAEGDGSCTLPVGSFASWLAGMTAALQGEQPADVPCGTCTACCTSSQFVHIGPEEKDTLARVPAELLFPAPGLPRGHVLLGYDEQGRCPMLSDGACSIYAHRPRTCRTYDCRVYAAAGVDPADDGKPLVARQVERWRFSYESPLDQSHRDAVRAAAEAAREQREGRVGSGPRRATDIAVRAIETYTAFLPGEA
jgi:Fe-S-cluster containining protein